MNCKSNNSCCSPTQQWKEMLLNTQDKAIQAYNLAQQALDEIENLPAGGGSVQSVNGELPDADGDVTIDTGVMTVNGVSADADGDFTVSGGQNVTVTETTNGIEISAEGGSPEAVAPIYIDQDGKIAIKGWTLVTDKNWARYAPTRIANTDLYLVCYNGSTDYLFGETFIPKGANINGFRLDLETMSSGNVYIKVACIDVYNIINDNASISNVLVASANVYTTGSGIDERMVAATTTNYSSFNKIFTETGLGIKLYVREVL